MWARATEIEQGATLETEVCIAGGGAAGISLALQFAGRKRGVILLEGGGAKVSERSRSFYRGQCDEPLTHTYLVGSRLRFFGGTTNHWLGYCLTLDPVDFEVRDWVADSGWPIDRADLEPYYTRAAEEICGLDQPLRTDEPVVDGSPAVFKPMRRNELRFGRAYREALTVEPYVQVLVGANLVGVRARREGHAVDRVEVVSLDGERRFTVKAKYFVLAMGAVENARMLLNADDVHTTGLGNRHDLVGRYFQEHAVISGAEVAVAPGQADLLTATPPWPRILRLSDEAQRRNRLQNCMFGAGLVPRAAETPQQLLSEGAWQRFARYFEQRGGVPEIPRWQRPEASTQVEQAFYWKRFSIRPEQAPVAENRVSLGDERDELGLRRCHLRWRLPRESLESARRSVLLLAETLGRNGFGRLRIPQSLFEEEIYSPGFHHMGTTRMHPDARRGVVDADGRVHGVENLFVAGSSVFPTSGAANPTFTIVALAIRLGDHLHRLLETRAM